MWFLKTLVLALLVSLSTPAMASEPPTAAPYEVHVDGSYFPDSRQFRGGRRAYMWGNGLALTGAGLALAGTGMVGAIAANCQDTQHGCIFAMLGVLTITWVPAAVLIPTGELLSTHGANRMGIARTRVPHWVFLGALGATATGMLLVQAEPLYGVGVGMVVGGASVAALAALTQVGVNIGAYRRDRLSGFAVAPTLVSPRTAGLAVAMRF